MSPSPATGTHKLAKRLRQLLGLERLGERTLDYITQSNMRLATVVAPVVAIGALAVLVWAFAGLDATGVPHDYPYVLVCVTILLLPSCIALFVVARRYVTGRIAKRTTAHRALGAFIVTGYVYAVALAIMALALFGRMSVLYIFFVVSGVLFALNPLVQTVTTLAALTAFLSIAGYLGFADYMLDLSCSSVALVIIIAGALRYDEMRHSVIDTIRLDAVSRTDALTGLNNRLALDVDRKELVGHGLIVAMVDIDDFKHFNDTYSHETGDEVLTKFSEVIVKSFPEATVYRYGGDEFFVVEKDTRIETAFRKEAKDFLRETRDIRISADPDETISASLGYAIGKPHDEHELEDLMRLADFRLYDAKRAGKNRFAGGVLGRDEL